MYLMNYVFMP
jgi:hypothetical protein